MDQKFNDDTNPFAGRDEAIRNLGGMVWLYEKHLAKFIVTYAASPLYIRSLLISGQSNEARIMAHSIKGLAGTLGMSRLYRAAAALEKAIINSELDLENPLLHYEICMNEILDFHDKD